MKVFSTAALAVVALGALITTSAQASLIVQTGNIPQIDNNVINGGSCPGVNGPALALEACFNSQTAPIVNIVSDENIVYDAGGQAKVDPGTGEYSRLTISVDAATINTLILNIQTEDDGFVKFTDGVTTSSVFALDDSGNNFFTITGGPFGFISYTTYSDLAGTTESDIVDSTRQIRIGLSTPTDVPEPATLAIFGIGLLGLGVMARRRKTA